MFVQLFHPLLLLSQSTKLGADRKQTKKAYFLDQGPFVRQSLTVVTQMTRDPTPLLSQTFDILDCPELETDLGRAVRREHLHWSKQKKNAVMIKFLFDSLKDVDVQQMVLPLLRSHGAALTQRFRFGVLNEFHLGGKYYDTAAALRREPALATTPLNTDSIERGFGIYSDKKKKLNGNTALNSTSGCATYVANDTSEWMKNEISAKQRDMAIQMSRRKGHAMAETGQLGSDMKVRVGAAHLQKKKNQADKNEADLERKVEKHLKLRSSALLLPAKLNVRHFDVHTADMTPAATTRYLKECQTILKLCFGVNGKDLVAYSHGGDRFDHSTLALAFRGLLNRIEQGELKIPTTAMDIVEALMKDRPPYRGGTHSKKFLKLQADRKEKYRQIISKVKVCCNCVSM